MAYRYRSRRSTRRLARKSRRNFIITLFIIGILIYATIQWVLPYFISGIGLINSIIKPSKKIITQNDVSLAPPVLNISYEATNTAQMNIEGFATPFSKVKLYLDDEAKHEAEVSSDGSFTVENISLLLGTNLIFGKTVDEKGQMSLPSKTIRLIYDNEKPTLEIFEPDDGKNIQGERKIKIAGKAEPQASVFVNGIQVILDKEGKFESIQTLNDGTNQFSIKAQDAAQNYTELIRQVTFQP